MKYVPIVLFNWIILVLHKNGHVDWSVVIFVTVASWFLINKMAAGKKLINKPKEPMKQELADQIRDKVKELNPLLEKACELGLTVNVHRRTDLPLGSMPARDFFQAEIVEEIRY